VPITAFGGEGDRMSDAELQAWGKETEGSFEVEMLPGGHSSSRRPARIAGIAFQKAFGVHF